MADAKALHATLEMAGVTKRLKHPWRDAPEAPPAVGAPGDQDDPGVAPHG